MLGHHVESIEAEAAIQLKGSSFTMPVLKLLTTEPDAISRQLAEHVQQAPEFFQNAPLVIDLSAVKDQGSGTNLALLIGLVRSNGLLPVAVRGGSEDQNEVAASMELATMSGTTSQPLRGTVRTASTESRQLRTKFLNQPVRSGQRVYAPGTDLVVLSQVSSGAEVFADGHIHVYGALRGRALAGIKGDTEARIFCQQLYAELVSIAGHYRVSDELDHSLLGKPAQLYLDGNRLHIAAL